MRTLLEEANRFLDEDIIAPTTVEAIKSITYFIEKSKDPKIIKSWNKILTTLPEEDKDEAFADYHYKYMGM